MTVRRTYLDLVTSRATVVALAVLLGVSLTACGSKSNNGSSTNAPGDSSTPWPTSTDTEIPIENPAPAPVADKNDDKALEAFQQALTTSTQSAKATGLTEVWTDSDGVKTLIVVWDQAKQQSISLDVELDSADIGEFEYMTPAIAQADIDSIKSGDSENGMVNYTKDHAFFVKTDIDGEEYITTYTLNNKGELGTAKTYVAGDLLGSVQFTYSITADGKTAIAATK